MEQDIINEYQQHISVANERVDKYKSLVNTYSFMRLGLFALSIVAIAVAKSQDNFSIIAVSFVILLLIFAWLVSKQSGFETQRQYFQHLVKVNENEVNSILNHGNIYDNGQQYSNEKHFYTSDLDIFGNASLFQLTNRAATTTRGG